MKKLKWIKGIAFIIAAFSLLMVLPSCSSDDDDDDEESSIVTLQREAWSPDVKQAVNDFVTSYANTEDAYAVFDFDNTSVIFDIEEQLGVYQLEVMAFKIEPDNLKDVLLTGLSDTTSTRSSDYFENDCSYSELAGDICTAYSALYNDYGPFSAEGLSEAKQAEIQAEDNWKEFATKMRMMYDLIGDEESADVAYPWILYWFTGMTKDEVYNLSKASCTKYSKELSEYVTWTSPSSITSNAGVASVTWTKGVSPATEMAELWNTLQSDGIDVWVCSASSIEAVRGAIDAFGLKPYITGLLGMTNKVTSEGVFINEYDYTTGCGYVKNNSGNLTVETDPIKAQTQGIGKVTAIENAILPRYNNAGPLAGFMDSTGDFNFCTEFKNLKVVICFNRANRKVTDGGGLIAEIAMYERDTLGYDFAKAVQSGDTLYVLQGRNENGLRGFRPYNTTLRLGSDEELLFKNDDNYTELDYIINNKLTVEQAIETLCIKDTGTTASAVGLSKIGFLKTYNGYHSR